MLRQNKIKVFSSFTILLLTSNELQAQVIAWGLANTQPIPISFTSMVILAGILGIFGQRFIKNNKNLIQKSPLIIALIGSTLFTGLGISIDKAIAAITTITINTPTGTLNLVVNGDTRVTNNYTGAIEITGITPHGCTISSNTCVVGTILNPTESCEITTSACPDTTPPVLSSVTQAFAHDIGDPEPALVVVTALDAVDGVRPVTQVGVVDFDGPSGAYPVTYSATDLSANTSTITHTYNVVCPGTTNWDGFNCTN